jgi:hypothetical protein
VPPAAAGAHRRKRVSHRSSITFAGPGSSLSQAGVGTAIAAVRPTAATVTLSEEENLAVMQQHMRQSIETMNAATKRVEAVEREVLALLRRPDGPAARELRVGAELRARAGRLVAQVRDTLTTL